MNGICNKFRPRDLNRRDIMVTSSYADSQELTIDAEMVRSKRTMTSAPETGPAFSRANRQIKPGFSPIGIRVVKQAVVNAVSGLLIAYPEPE